MAARILVPTNAGKSQIDACMAAARADGPGTWVVFPAGKFAYAGTLVVPDYINLTGQGIWDQGTADGNGGTWLQCPIEWGSYSTVEKILLGFNAAGKTCTFSPCPKDNSACGTYTQAHGSTGCTFSQVRFKGGSDTGASLISVFNNGIAQSVAHDPLKLDFMIDTTFTDCEFERPQALNSVNVTSAFPGGNPGLTLMLWVDTRPGGAQIANDSWIRCHFGVENGYHTGIDGYGTGTGILVQGGPEGSAASDQTLTPPNAADLGCELGYQPGGKNNFKNGGSNVVYQHDYTTTTNPYTNMWNPSCDWSDASGDHYAHDLYFKDCLFEYSCWYPMDLCDGMRTYSMWHGIKQWIADGNSATDCLDGYAASGWGNPPGTKWTTISSREELRNFNMTGCYLKGSYPKGHSINGEICAYCNFIDCVNGSGGVFDQGGRYGNVVSGSFPGGHPVSPIFTSDWTGATTSYTPSPHDP